MVETAMIGLVCVAALLLTGSADAQFDAPTSRGTSPGLISTSGCSTTLSATGPLDLPVVKAGPPCPNTTPTQGVSAPLSAVLTTTRPEGQKKG